MLNKKNLIFAFILLIFLFSTSIVCATDPDNTIDDMNVESIENEQIPIEDVNEVKTSINYGKEKKDLLKSPPSTQVEISMEDKTIYYGEELEINPVISCEGDYDGILTTYIDEDIPDIRNLSFDSSDFIINSESYYPGEYTITLDLGGSANYDNTQTTAILTVLKRPVIIGESTLFYDDNNDVLVNLGIRDSITDDPITEGTLSIRYNDNEIQTVDVDSNNLSFVISKDYIDKTLIIEYSDQYEIYSDSFSTIAMDMDKFDLDFTVSELNSNDNRLISSFIELNSNRVINDGEMDVFVDGVLDSVYYVSSNNVNIIIDPSKYSLGEHEIEFYYTNSNVYNSLRKSSTLTLKNSTRIILLNTNTIQKGDTTIITGILYNGNTRIPDKNVIVNIGGENYNTETNINGIFSVIYTAEHAGNIPVTASFSEDDMYLESGVNGTFIVNKIASNLEFNHIPNTVVGSLVNITLTLRNFTSTLSGENITLTVNDKTDTYTTDSNGQVTIPYQANSTGTISLYAHYNESNDYLESSANSQFNVIKEETEIITEDSIVIVGSTIDISAILSTSDGSLIEGKTIIFKVNETEYTNTTNFYGQATVHVYFDTVGNYTANVLFIEDAQYNGSNATFNIIVIKRNSTLNASIINSTAGNVTVHVYVTDDNYRNSPISFGTVTIKNGEEIIGTGTIVDGTGNIQINIDKSGTYNLNVEYLENEYYNSDVQTLENIVVNKRLSQTDLTVNNNTYRNTSVTVIVKDSISGNIINEGKLEVSSSNGVKKIVNINSTGQTIVDINLDVGRNVSITAKYMGNITYLESSDTQVINVEKRGSKIEATVLNSTAGNVTLNVTVTDTVTGELVSDGTVTIKNGKSIIGTGTINNGSVTITTNIDKKGEYNLNIIFEGNENYNSSNCNIPTTVSLREINLDVKIKNTTIQNATIEVKVTDKSTTQPVANISLRVVDENGNEVGTGKTDINGTLNIILDVPAGKQNITVIIPATDTYNTRNKTLEININKLKSFIDLMPINNSTLSGSTVINGILSDANGNLIAYADITLNINNIDYNLKTNKNGIFTYTIRNLDKTGLNNVTVTFNENNVYLGSLSKSNFTVSKIPTITTITKYDSTIAENASISVKVINANTGKIIKNGTIKVSENNRLIGIGTINSTGTTTIKLDIHSTGLHKINAEFTGTDTYTNSNSSTTLTIVKHNTSITLKPVSNVKVGKITKITTQVLDNSTNSLLGNAKIKLNINGITKELITDSNSMINYEYTTKTVGQNNITVEYLGDENNNPSTATGTFDVLKRNVTITVDPIDSVIKENVTITAHVTDEFGEAVNSGLAVLKLNGMTLRENGIFNQTGNSMKLNVINGTAKYTLTAEKYMLNAHYLSATYGGSTNYIPNKTEKNANASIKLREATVKTSVNQTTVEHEEYITLIAQVRDKTTGLEPLYHKNSYVIFKINGATLKDSNGTIKVAVNRNGIATYKYFIKNGLSSMRNYTVEAVYSNTYYNRIRSENVSFHVNKSEIKITFNNIKIDSSGMNINANIKTIKGSSPIGENKICIKINGKTITDAAGNTQYFTVKNGKINLTVNSTVNDVKTVTIVTGERLAYLGTRATTKEVSKTLTSSP